MVVPPAPMIKRGFGGRQQRAGRIRRRGLRACGSENEQGEQRGADHPRRFYARSPEPSAQEGRPDRDLSASGRVRLARKSQALTAHAEERHRAARRRPHRTGMADADAEGSRGTWRYRLVLAKGHDLGGHVADRSSAVVDEIDPELEQGDCPLTGVPTSPKNALGGDEATKGAGIAMQVSKSIFNP